MENDIATCCAQGDAKQLKRLNQSHAELEKELAEAQAALESFIASL